MSESLLNGSTLMVAPSAQVNKTMVAINNRENGRPQPALVSYFADTPNKATLPPQYWGTGQPAIPVVQTSGGWCVVNGELTFQTPLPSGGTVGYLSTPNLGANVTRVLTRFRFSSTDPNGVACIAITSGVPNPSGVMPNMACHLHCSPYTWTFGIWQGTVLGGGGETILGNGDFAFATGMDPGTDYEMECVIRGTTAYVRLPDGSIQTFTNSLIGTYGAGCNYAFLEGYTTGSTNSYPLFSHFLADTGVSAIPSPGWLRAVDPVVNGTLSVANLEITGPNGPVYGDLAACITGLGVVGWTPPSTLGLVPFVNATITRQTLAAANTYLGSAYLAAGTLVAGNHYRITLLFSNPATASTSTVRVYYGTTGTTSDTAIHTVTYTGTAAADVARVVIDVQVDVINASTGAITVFSTLSRNLGGGTTGFHNVAGNPTATTQTSTLNTSTTSNALGIAVQETAATTVLLNATIEYIH